MAVEPLPAGFGIEFDPATDEVASGVFVGGRPMRVMRVTDAGRAALAELRVHPVGSAATGALARRLTDAGVAHPVPPGASNAAELTVIVAVYGRPAMLESCLHALGRQHEVIVVDDGSPDAAGIRAVVGRHGARLLRLDRNGGPATARNAGLTAVRTPLVAFVDSDTRPSARSLDALAAHLLDPLVAAAAPRIRPSVGYGTRGGRSVVARLAAAACPLDLGPQAASVRPYGAVSYVPTAVLVARRDALLAAAQNGAVFDHTLRYGEDVDLVWRLLAGGWRVRYVPEVEVDHQEPARWHQLLRRRFAYGTSAAPLSRRHPRNVAPFVVHPAFTATVVAALAGRPALTAAGAGVSVAQVSLALRRAGVPQRRLALTVLAGLGQTVLGLGRYATRFAGPLLLTAALRRPRADHRPATVRLSGPAAAALLLGPAASGWWHGTKQLDPARHVAASLLDDMAYGAGVLAGCVRHRTVRPLVPRGTGRHQPDPHLPVRTGQPRTPPATPAATMRSS